MKARCELQVLALFGFGFRGCVEDFETVGRGRTALVTFLHASENFSDLRERVVFFKLGSCARARRCRTLRLLRIPAACVIFCAGVRCPLSKKSWSPGRLLSGPFLLWLARNFWHSREVWLAPNSWHSHSDWLALHSWHSRQGWLALLCWLFCIANRFARTWIASACSLGVSVMFAILRSRSARTFACCFGVSCSQVRHPSPRIR